jgi:hypothetical protein
MGHEHGVGTYFSEKRGRDGDSRWYADFGGLGRVGFNGRE